MPGIAATPAAVMPIPAFAYAAMRLVDLCLARSMSLLKSLQMGIRFVTRCDPERTIDRGKEKEWRRF